MNKINRDEAKRVIATQGNQIFGVTFVKKNGEVRKMNCRRQVKAFLKGGELKYDANAHNLITVFDLQKEDYRAINVEGLTELRAGGKIYQVVGE